MSEIRKNTKMPPQAIDFEDGAERKFELSGFKFQFQFGLIPSRCLVMHSEFRSLCAEREPIESNIRGGGPAPGRGAGPSARAAAARCRARRLRSTLSASQ